MSELDVKTGRRAREEARRDRNPAMPGLDADVQLDTRGVESMDDLAPMMSANELATKTGQMLKLVPVLYSDEGGYVIFPDIKGKRWVDVGGF